MRQRWHILWLCLLYGLCALAQPEDSLAQITHVVSAGETLTAIAAAYGVTVNDIASANGLDPNALLRIGQRLVIEFNTSLDQQNADSADSSNEANADKAEAAEEASLAAPAEAAARDEARAIGGLALENDLPPAPVAAADAPKQDPAALDSVVCVTIFVDENQNSLQDASESALSDGAIRLMDADGMLLEELRVAATAQPLCIKLDQPRIYRLGAIAPEGFGLTGPEALRVDLRAGGPVPVAFGLQAGFDAPVAPLVDMSSAGAPASAESAGANLLRELSGLFVLAVAGFTLLCGLLFSMFLRFSR